MEKLLGLVFVGVMFFGCGGGGGGAGVEANPTSYSNGNVISGSINKNEFSGTGSQFIRGVVKYERVNVVTNKTTTRLDWSNLSEKPARNILVHAINEQGEVVASTYSDEFGNYQLNGIPSNSRVKVRIYALMYKSAKWDVSVVDNQSLNAQYVSESSYVDINSSNLAINLVAPASTTASAPFAILDSVYVAMKKVLSADTSVVFPPLVVNWSTGNINTNTYYSDGNITVLGDQNGDSDEYDNHVIIHEWGHYFEDKFSRSDSIGGSHGSGQHLDIRVAFGEGWGNAWSAIATDDPLYFDTQGNTGFNFNVESASHETPGFFSEASIQRILYDLYDSNSDGADTLSLGFKPIYDVFVGAEKTTPAFTSIFSFITALKANNVSQSSKIDAIVNSESISSITDIYGTNRNSMVEQNLNLDVLPLYDTLSVGTSVNRCTSSHYGATDVNKLGNHKYFKVHINSLQDYTVSITKTSGLNANLQFRLFEAGTKTFVINNSLITNTLSVGDYLLDVWDTTGQTQACFNVQIN
jgi:hypothetical protein